MKVCLIAPIPPYRGGIAKYCYSLALELEKRHELLLLSYQRQYPALLFGKKSQIDPEVDRNLILKEFHHDLSYDIDSVNPVSWLGTARRIDDFNPDLVIFPWWVAYWAPMYLFLLHSLKKRGIRCLFLCINVYEHEDHPVKKFLTKFTLGRVHDFIVHSELEKGEILRFNPTAVVRKHLLPLFTYENMITRRHDSILHLLFFGFVRPYKGLDILLRAIGILKDRDISLRIVGEFWHDKTEYLSLINDLGISHKVEIIDQYVPDYEMSRYFGSADLVVLPYRESITSGIIATAYGFGKPVLATDVGGFHEVVQDGYTGKIVASGDHRRLAEGIEWFIANRYVNFAENISTFTSKKMSWSSLTDLIEKMTGHNER
jgi:glycosyltransferase involved in cell wall biosynthesis